MRKHKLTAVSSKSGDIDVSSVRGRMYGTYLDETCVFLPGGPSEVVGSFDDHNAIVATVRFMTENN